MLNKHHMTGHLSLGTPNECQTIQVLFKQLMSFGVPEDTCYLVWIFQHPSLLKQDEWSHEVDCQTPGTCSLAVASNLPWPTSFLPGTKVDEAVVESQFIQHCQGSKSSSVSFCSISAALSTSVLARMWICGSRSICASCSAVACTTWMSPCSVRMICVGD